jgi:site-specific DNA recombinase
MGKGIALPPSFTIKRGRRYRYYISQLTLKNPAEQCKGATRLPAHEVESRITERLEGFLKSDAEIFDGLSVPGDSPAMLRPLVAAAKKLATRLPSFPRGDLRDLLASFLHRVIIQENNIQVMIIRTCLRELLEKGDQIIASNFVGLRGSVDASDMICLTVEAKRKQYGGEVHLIVPPSSGASIRHPRASLIKAIARSHAWYEKVLEGKIVEMRSLAREAGLTPHYVRNVFACAFLAPDIVEAILEGRQPLTLKFANLYKHIPLSWAEQRRLFGFPQDSASRQVPPAMDPDQRF